VTVEGFTHKKSFKNQQIVLLNVLFSKKYWKQIIVFTKILSSCFFFKH